MLIHVRSPLARTLGAALFALALASCSPLSPTAPVANDSRTAIRTANANLEVEMLDDVVVTLAPGADAAAVAREAGGVLLSVDGCSHARIAPPGEVPCDEFVAQLATDGRVVTAEQDATLETAESRQESYASDDGLGSSQTYAEQPAAQSVNLDAAHRVSLGEAVKIAILDTGVDPAHPALYGHLGAGYDFIGRDADPTDDADGRDDDHDGHVDEAWGHGTHVAGILALTAPRAVILPVRVLDSDGRGTVGTVAAGLRWAINSGARVINLSLGMLHHSNAIQKLLDEAEAKHIVVVCSAGNWGSEFPREYPAADDEAIAIAASDAAAHPAPFTSYGSHIAVCAPGVGVRSSYPGGGYRLWSGTSMSAPFVAGTAALLLMAHPAWTAEQVLDRIGETARPLADVSPLQSGKLGEGALDAGAALAPDLTTLAGNSDPSADDPGVVAR